MPPLLEGCIVALIVIAAAWYALRRLLPRSRWTRWIVGAPRRPAARAGTGSDCDSCRH